MRSHHWAIGLLDPVLAFAQSNPQVAVSTTYIGVCLSDGSTGGYGVGGGGNGTGGSGSGGNGYAKSLDIVAAIKIGKLICSSGSTVAVTSVSSPYGMYSQLGWYSNPASGYLLDGSQTTSPQMSLTYCASFCGGAPFFAVENGEFFSSPNTDLWSILLYTRFHV